MTTKEELIQDLQDFAEEIGETPTGKEMSDNGPWSQDTYADYFGTWTDALIAAGMEPNIRNDFSKEELIEDLQSFADTVDGETPTIPQMDNEGPWSATLYVNEFGSWNEAVREAGLEPNHIQHVSDEELIEDLKEYAGKIGETPTISQMEDHHWSWQVYVNHFGSWNDALRAAGLEVNREYGVSDEILVEDINQVASKLGRRPSSNDIREHGRMGLSVYVMSFGSWNEALRKAGFEPIQEYPVECQWPDDVEDYFGESFPEMREKVIERDGNKCQICGSDDDTLVHHIKPRRSFPHPDDSNTMDNMIVVCASCHGKVERRWVDLNPEEFAATAAESFGFVD